ncbi:S8 family peptidase [Streptomyces griseorubiginosus]|uniref:1,4-dihydropyridine esterase n=1 Tax=Streptomyces griseorubiginosus TaxID=67304 RepID=A0A101SE53_9ACTN|nr:S8 family serine peptidase [Streptomyces griseorubiginosus]KUN71993.1 1,4-dihydropyridine esterase [Streptomyces griseorubiginosus]
MRDRTTSASLAALLVAGLMAGVSVAATGSGLGVRTEDTATVAAPGGSGLGARTTGSASAAGGRYVTLLTGDRVRLDARGRVTGVRQAPGREHIPVSVRGVGGDQYAVPADAAALIGQGVLDIRLFDVSGLIRAGYDDTRRGTLPLIVSYEGKSAQRRSTQKSLVADADATVRRELPSVAGAAITVPKAGADDMWKALTEEQGIARVWLDGRFKAPADEDGAKTGEAAKIGEVAKAGEAAKTGEAAKAGQAAKTREAAKAGEAATTEEAGSGVAQIGAPAAWAAGYDGKGVKVAVLDTGIDTTHPDLASAVKASKNFTGTDSTDDMAGHGTHVAATLAGSGERSGGRYKGVAPGAEILNAKVLDDNGEGSDSGVIAGLEWAAGQGAKVANLSLGQADTPGEDPVEAAVNALSKSTGMLTVAAAGNEGPDAGTVDSPGAAESALTVGAVDGEDRLADFSSTGPTADNALKPDLTAPGVDIVSARAAHGHMGDPAADGYVSMSGTSMATPHAAGAAAILAQQHPDWTGARIKQALTASTTPTTGATVYQQGTGRVDVSRALKGTVASEQTSVSFGKQLWPHTDDRPLTRHITYRNDGDHPVTLDLTAGATGPGGSTAPEGMFTLSTTQLTVPAGGTAGVDLTTDTRVEAADGTYSGTLVATERNGADPTPADLTTARPTPADPTTARPATADPTAVRTAFGVVREAEAHDLTLKFLDRAGKPVSAPLTEILAYSGTYWTTNLRDAEQISKGVYRVRVPRGDYVVDTVLEDAEGTSALVRPRLSLTRDTTVVFDARKAKPVGITAPQGAKMSDGQLNLAVGTGNTGATGDRGGDAHNSTLFWGTFKNLRTASLGPNAAAGRLSTQLGGLWQKGSTTYHLLHNLPDRFPTGYRHTTRMNELALLKRNFGSSAAHRKGIVNVLWSGPTLSLGTVSDPFPLPTTAKIYVTTPKGFKWTANLGQRNVSGDDDIFYGTESARSYQAVRTYAATYNVGVFSPITGGPYGARRDGDTLDLCVPDLADGAGHPASSTAKRHTKVTADGSTLLDNDGDLCQTVEKLPSAQSRYTIRTTLTRPPGVATTTSRLTAAWTFKSSPSDAGSLPLSTVRFHPKLTSTGTAPAGRRTTIPLSLQGPAATALKSLTVKVSYDAGKTWSPAPVTTTHGKRTLTLTHPHNASSVSLKSTLTDTTGNTYTVTILKAYLLT